MTHIRAAALLLFLLPGISGCGEEGETEPPPSGELLLGGADTAGVGFLEIEDFDDVELVSGAQGGFHVWTNFQVKDAAGPLYLRREARLVEEGTIVLRALPIRIEVPDDAMEGWWQMEKALPSFMCPPPIGVTIYDQELALTARLTDRDDETVFAEDHLVFVPRCPEGDLHEFCLRICAD